MKYSDLTPAGDAMTPLVLELLKLNALILTAGDRMVAGLGLTSARWQVLGAIDAAEHPQPVAWLARDMGANRQNVQRIINDLERDGLVAFEPNPHHRRAQLIVMTDAGRKTFTAAMQLHVPWVNDLTSGLDVADIATVRQVVATLQAHLQRSKAE